MYLHRFMLTRSTSDIVASNGIVVATEKKSSSILIDDSVIEKVAVICPNIGIVYSGMGPDFRLLVTRARKSAQAYWKIYGEYPPTKILTQEIANIMQQATHSGYVVLAHQRCVSPTNLYPVVFDLTVFHCWWLAGTSRVDPHCIKLTRQVHFGRGRRARSERTW